MSKTAKKKNSEKRRAAKKARKTANYLRFGPKAGHSGRRQKRKKNRNLKGQQNRANHAAGAKGQTTKSRGLTLDQPWAASCEETASTTQAAAEIGLPAEQAWS